MMIGTLINNILYSRGEDERMKTEYKTEYKTEVRFTENLLDKFRENVGRFRPETGGMIGCSGNPSVIDLYVFDKSSRNTSVSFDYDAKAMTKVYHEWKKHGGNVVGFIHSHPSNFMQPSYDDISMALALMRFFKNNYFYMPIVRAEKHGYFTIYFYILRMNENEITETFEYVIKATDKGYSIIPQNRVTNTYSVKKLEKHYGPDKVAAERERRIASAENPGFAPADMDIKPYYSQSELFARLSGVFPEKVLNKTVVMVGCGGGRTIIENLTRNGFRNFILIDGDTVAPSNVATQGVFISEIGKKKAYAIRDRIKDINPDVNVLCVDSYLDESVSDEQFAGWLNSFNGKKATDYLILGCTDNFYAQKRISLLSLKYSIPYIGAAMYEKGLVAETIFLYPGLTKSCPRCLLRSRYEAYENGYQNTVTSAGCPSFATERLNTLIGYLCLMILMYHEAPDSPYNEMLEKIADRNFAWIRLSPYLGESSLGISIFDKIFNDEKIKRFVFMDETLWIPQHPDSSEYGEEPCKLCGGNGDLRILRGRWKDTRKTDTA